SRRRHTRFSRDWSSDVCSSDLGKIKLIATLFAIQSFPSTGVITGQLQRSLSSFYQQSGLVALPNFKFFYTAHLQLAQLTGSDGIAQTIAGGGVLFSEFPGFYVGENRRSRTRIQKETLYFR